MKRPLSLIAILMSCLATTVRAWDNASDAKLPQSSRRVVMMGNSITQYWQGHEENNHKEFFTQNGALCRGVAGQKTPAMVSRFDTDVIGLKPLIVVIAGGVNDINGGSTADEVFANTKAMAEKAVAAGIRPILATINPSGWGKDTNNKYIAYNKKVKEYCDQQGYAFCNYFDVLTMGTVKGNFLYDGTYNEMKPEYRGRADHSDHLHPCREGYLVMESVLIPLIEQQLWQGDSYEAEHAVKSGNAIKDAADADASGGTRVGYIGVNNTLSFGYTANKAGTFNLTVYYATAVDRNLALTVNGSKSTTRCAATGGYNLNKRSQVTIAVTLKKGYNTFVVGNQADDAPNIDKFTISDQPSDGTEDDSSGVSQNDGGTGSSFSIEDAVRRCDVNRTDYRPVVNNQAQAVNLYQGNGEMGCSYGPLGLHLRTDLDTGGKGKYGETKLMNLSHRVRARYNHDYLVPLLQICWDDEPASVSNYSQQQSYYDGTITTAFNTDGGTYTVQSWFDPVELNLGYITINATKGGRTITIDPMESAAGHYGQTWLQAVSMAEEEDGYRLTISCSQYQQGGTKQCAISKSSDVYVYTNATVITDNNNLRLTLNEGDNYIRISYGKASATQSGASLQQTADWWHHKWETQGMLVLSDLHAQQTWVRSMAMFLSSYDDKKNGLCPPLGFTGSNWSFYYPQDVSYVHPLFVATGNIDIARSWIEKWAAEIEGQRQYTKRIYGQDGVMIPWVYPYLGFDGYHDGGFPMHTYGQIHQGAYYVRMAAEVANVLQDDSWTSKNLLPILQGVAEFYSNIASKHDDGLWHFHNNPSCGQDEFGGDNQTDYIDVLYAAQYVLQEAVKRGIDPNGRYSQILTDGIAFPALLDPTDSYYYAYLGGSDTYGKQKHPAQLNELLYAPCYTEPTAPARFVYQHRNDMTVDAKKPFYWGWTLGAFLLAGSRLGDVEGWKADWANMSRSNYVDQEWIQSFETSTHWNMAFYNINNGLIAQSLLNNLMCDWFGRLEIAKCNPWEGTQYIKDIASQLGVTVNGTVNGKTYDVTLTAWKDCSFTFHGQQVILTKGQSQSFTDTAAEMTEDTRSLFYLYNVGAKQWIKTGGQTKTPDSPILVDLSERTAEVITPLSTEVETGEGPSYTISDQEYTPQGWGVQGRNTIYESNNGSTKTNTWGTTLIPGWRFVSTGDADGSVYIEYTWGQWTKGTADLDDPSGKTYILFYGDWALGTNGWKKDFNEVAGKGVWSDLKANAATHGDYAKWLVVPVGNGSIDIVGTRGDINEDGRTDSGDVTTLAYFLSGQSVAPFNKTAADLNGDGNVSISDLAALVGLLMTLQGQCAVR